MALAPPRVYNSAYLSPHSNHIYPSTNTNSIAKSSGASASKRSRPKSALPVGSSTAFFPPSAKLPLDPFEHLEPPTWDVDISGLDALIAMRSMDVSDAASGKTRNVVLVLGDPQPHALRPLLTSPLLSNSLIILISHDPPSLNDIYATLHPTSISTTTPVSISPSQSLPTLYIIKVQTPIILLSALKLVKVVEQAQTLAKAWRKNESVFRYAERPYVSFVQQQPNSQQRHQQQQDVGDGHRYHYAKMNSSHGNGQSNGLSPTQPRSRHISTSSSSQSYSGSAVYSHTIPVPRVVLFAEQSLSSSSSKVKHRSKGSSSSPPALSFAEGVLVGEFIPVNEYDIEIVPAAGSRGGLFGSANGASAGGGSAGGSYGRSSGSGWARFFGGKRRGDVVGGGGVYGEERAMKSYTDGIGMNAKSSSKISLPLSLPTRLHLHMPRIGGGRRLSKLNTSMPPSSFNNANDIASGYLSSSSSSSPIQEDSQRPLSPGSYHTRGHTQGNQGEMKQDDPAYRPFDVVVSFLPYPESVYRVPPASSDGYNNVKKGGGGSGEVVGISEKVLLKQSILVTTLVGPFVVDAVLGSGVWMGRLGTGGGGQTVGAGRMGRRVESESEGSEKKRERHQTWTMGASSSIPISASPISAAYALSALGIGRVRGRIIHILPTSPSSLSSTSSSPSAPRSSGNGKKGKGRERAEKSKLASGIEQFLIEYGVGRGLNGSSTPNLTIPASSSSRNNDGSTSHSRSPPPSRGSASSASAPTPRDNSHSPFGSALNTPVTSRTSTSSSNPVHSGSTSNLFATGKGGGGGNASGGGGDGGKPISFVLPASALSEVVYSVPLWERDDRTGANDLDDRDNGDNDEVGDGEEWDIVSNQPRFSVLQERHRQAVSNKGLRKGKGRVEVTVFDCVVGGILDEGAGGGSGLRGGGLGARAWIGGREEITVVGAPLEHGDDDFVLEELRRTKEGNKEGKSQTQPGKVAEKSLPNLPPPQSPPHLHPYYRRQSPPRDPPTANQAMNSNMNSGSSPPPANGNSSKRTKSASVPVPPPMIRQRAQSQEHSYSASSQSPDSASPRNASYPHQLIQIQDQTAMYVPLRKDERRSYQAPQAQHDAYSPVYAQAQAYATSPAAEAVNRGGGVPSRSRNRAQSQTQGLSGGYSADMPSITSLIAFPSVAGASAVIPSSAVPTSTLPVSRPSPPATFKPPPMAMSVLSAVPPTSPIAMDQLMEGRIQPPSSVYAQSTSTARRASQQTQGKPQVHALAPLPPAQTYVEPQLIQPRVHDELQGQVVVPQLDTPHARHISKRDTEKSDSSGSRGHSSHGHGSSHGHSKEGRSHHGHSSSRDGHGNSYAHVAGVPVSSRSRSRDCDERRRSHDRECGHYQDREGEGRKKDKERPRRESSSRGDVEYRSSGRESEREREREREHRKDKDKKRADKERRRRVSHSEASRSRDHGQSSKHRSHSHSRSRSTYHHGDPVAVGSAGEPERERERGKERERDRRRSRSRHHDTGYHHDHGQMTSKGGAVDGAPAARGLGLPTPPDSSSSAEN